MYDVIVVGAGPSGSMAATCLAKNDIKTLLIDRENFPRNKACGDVVQASAFSVLADIGLKGPFDTDKFYEVERIRITGPKGTSVNLEFTQDQGKGTRVVSRYEFDNTLLDHAVKSGSEFCVANIVGPLLEDGQITGVILKNNQEIKSKIVIAADGATSAIARNLNTGQIDKKHTAVALRGYIHTTHELEPALDFSFFEAIQPGYAWFFPMGKYLANVGVGMRSDYYKKKGITLQQGLEMYLKSPKIKAYVGDNVVEEVKSWQLPLCSVNRKRVFDGAILVGDAGGFVNPLTGAGIYQAIITGKYAADAAMKAIKSGDYTQGGLSIFDRLWKHELAWEMQRSTFVQDIITHFPGLMDIILNTTAYTPHLVRYIIGKV